MYSKQSIQGVVFGSSSEARHHGKGGIWYLWKPDSSHNFPDDVASVFIVMPVSWGDDGHGVVCEWTVGYKNHCGAQWSLSGSSDKPTLSPSLNWVDMWHGYLRDGYLASCE